MFKRAVHRLLAAPPKLGDLYRYQENAKEWVLVIPEDFDGERLQLRNVTASGGATYIFPINKWHTFLLRGTITHQPWFNELDF